MFIAVRHGTDEQKLFNPDCSLCLLVDNIRKRCQCSSNATVALLDKKWNIVHLSPHSMENASSLFADRAVYILLTVEKSEHGVKYTPLLENTDPTLIEFLSNPKASKPRPDFEAAKNWGKLRKKIRQNPPKGQSSLTPSHTAAKLEALSNLKASKPAAKNWDKLRKKIRQNPPKAK